MAPKGNRIKPSREEEPEEVITEKKPSRKEKTKAASPKTSEGSWIKSRFQFLSDERFRKIAGLFFILLSAYMVIAFTSFFATWKADSDKVNGPWISLLFDSSVKVDNWLGKFGAILSHTFIQNWFGVSAFVFVLLSFLAGFRILFGIQLIPFSKTLKYSTFGFFFVAATLAYLINSSSEYLFLAGAVGLEINKWLQSILGYAGTGILLLFSAVAFLVAVFNFAFRLPSFMTKKNQEPELESQREEVTEALEILAGNKLEKPEFRTKSNLKPRSIPTHQIRMNSLSRREAIRLQSPSILIMKRFRYRLRPPKWRLNCLLKPIQLVSNQQNRMFRFQLKLCLQKQPITLKLKWQILKF
jgi:hypothetical protein